MPGRTTPPPSAEVLLNCRRPGDCRCWRPVVIDGQQHCPRQNRDCICRWTWRSDWEKGDDHAQCPVHSPRKVIIIDAED